MHFTPQPAHLESGLHLVQRSHVQGADLGLQDFYCLLGWMGVVVRGCISEIPPPRAGGDSSRVVPHQARPVTPVEGSAPPITHHQASSLEPDSQGVLGREGDRL